MMKRNYIILGLLLFSACFLQAQIVITEISYNPPEAGTDSLEFIEIYNNSGSAVDLTGYAFTAGVVFTFPAVTINPGEYMVSGVNASALMGTLGVNAMEWTNGALSNGGEMIQLSDGVGNVIDEVNYDDAGDWPTSDTGTDGEGSTIELCDPDSDNSLPTNWRAADNGTGVTIDGKEFKGTPGTVNTVVCGTVADHDISAEGIVFIPADLTITVGETVRWTNNGGLHNVNGDQSVYPNNPESFSNGAVSSDPWTFDYTFTITGVYDYQCDQHVGAGMVGKITVMEEVIPPPILVISELFYNDPGNPDSLDFIEIYNNNDAAVDMTGFYFSGVDFTFPSFTLGDGEFVIIAGDSVAVKKYFGVDAFQYGDGLSSAGELLQLYSLDNSLIDEVNYLDTAPWPSEADGFGYSLTLCNLNSDNNDASNWKIASSSAGFDYMGTPIFANPGSKSYCNFDIETASAVDEVTGVALLDGATATLIGTVYGLNSRLDGLQFTLIDDANEGIALFSNSVNFGYSAVEGDELRVKGVIDQFNGLTQIVPDTLELLSTGNALFNPTVVTSLGESTESQLVRVENVSILDPVQWTNDTPGFNVEVGNGTETFAIRIDEDTDIFGMGYPSGTFTITGIGGQFDGTSPHDEGYQLLPRYVEDIDPYVPFVEEYPFYNIATVTTVNAQGVADSIDRTCELVGVVHGVNLRPSGLQFVIIDEFGDGIGVFNNTGDLGYTVTEGDEISVKGKIDQFNGYTEIGPFSVELLNTGVTLENPIETDVLNEDTESQLIKISKVLVMDDPSQWAGDGTSFNVTVVDVANATNEYEMRIDSDVELSTMAAPTGAFFLTGLGDQHDEDSPFVDGYQILPRYAADIEPTTPTIDLDGGFKIQLYPNPVIDRLNVNSDLTIQSLEILDITGKVINKFAPDTLNYNIDMAHLLSGLYHIRLTINDKVYSEQIIKM
jgi:plastocyanin/DNA/RNA endonuclease YhcR with UshA esterase domain